uniref:Phosphofructokinase n=1 Tax=Candidatus Kentrum eta TaxID=2126337 RepID=A0A450UIW6_9GAMM|nr:MAG: tagatose 6-phosphate kinase [Candidatus Kentron sp. H]VFJ92489.1 MAG: tagatose 6-phosphate kinase [Candidatus Kentron sp. H]VFJ99269.1 MAG: tagatose 6-phosphate kinase [Candidatus Kentron sp. H]
MILSVGLSPAWQQILVFDSVKIDQVNRARIAKWCASGKVFNAGVAIHTLGGPGLVVAPVGGVARGPMEEEFRALGMRYRSIETKAATRVCTTIIDKATGTITELVEEGHPLTPDELERCRAAFHEEARRAKVAVVMGSLPQGVPISFYRELLEKQRCPLVLDFRGDGLLSVLDLEPLVVKPNREELARTVGYSLDNDQALLDAMRSLNRRGAKWVVVTQGAASVWLSSTTAVYRMQPIIMDANEVVNPIGSGDAMAGAIAWIIGNRVTASKPAIVDAVRLGIAAAAQNVRQLLPCRLDASGLEVEAGRVSIERLE